MYKATLKRISEIERGTFGVLLAQDKTPLCVTLELPWKGNVRRVSCIPVGEYLCTPHSGVKYKNTWELQGVPGRDAILIHTGNTIADTEGCILVGTSYRLDGVAQSRIAFDKIKDILPDSFVLRVE